MRVLVTGSKGQVVTALAEAGAARGFEIIPRGRPELDLAAPDSISAVLARIKPDLVVNAAAYTAVDKAESEADDAHVVNAVGAEAVAAACAAIGISIVHLSTDFVFDGRKPGPYVETDPVAPLGIYGRSKVEGERRVSAANPRHMILRTSWVYSPWGTNFAKTMLRLAATRPEISVVEDQVGSPTYAPHLAAAILDVAERLVGGDLAGREPWGVYHTAGTGVASWYQLAREVFAVSGRLGGPVSIVRPIPTSAYPTLAERPKNSRLDTGKLRAVFGVTLPPWQVGVADCLRRLVEPATSSILMTTR